MFAQALAEELLNLLAEADKKEPAPKPSKEQIGSTLRKMSILAHQQTKHALRINSPAAHNLAAKTHMRVAQAAKRHNYVDLHKQHSAIAKDFRNAAKPDKEPKEPSPVPKKHAPVPPPPIPKHQQGGGPPGGPPPKVAPVRPRRGKGPPGGPPPNVPPVRPQTGGNVHHRSTRNAPRTP